MNDKIKFILWGIPAGSRERYEEVVLLSEATQATVDRVKEIASKDGFHGFRQVRLSDVLTGEVPNFAASIIS